MCRLFATAVPSLLRGPIVVKSNFLFRSTLATHQKFSFFWHLTQAQIPPTLSQHVCVCVCVCVQYGLCVCVCMLRSSHGSGSMCVFGGSAFVAVHLHGATPTFGGALFWTYPTWKYVCVCVCVSSIHRFNFLTDEIKNIRYLFLRMRLHLCFS